MRGKILVIDDDDNVRNTIALFFEDLNFEVKQTNNGTLALPHIREHRPDLVFCDLVMPHLSGLYVLKQIKDEFPDMRVIIMSGLYEEDTAEEARNLGALDYLAKPVGLQQLEEILDHLFPDSKSAES